jgi:hypothetical protein
VTDPLDSMFDAPDGPRPGAAPARKCRRHQWIYAEDGGWMPDVPRKCARCGRLEVPMVTRRGSNNRKRGNRIQRERITALGGRNLAGNNPNLDGLGERFRYESKSGGAFSERYWRWLKGIPLAAGQAGVLIVTEAPGPGRRARSIVVVDYDTWRDEHGEEAK